MEGTADCTGDAKSRSGATKPECGIGVPLVKLRGGWLCAEAAMCPRGETLSMQLSLAAEGGPELILLDLGTPGMSGYEVAKALRQQPWGQAIALIAVTGYGSAENRKASYDLGLDGHLVKPIDFDALQRTLTDRAAPRGGSGQPGESEGGAQSDPLRHDAC